MSPSPSTASPCNVLSLKAPPTKQPPSYSTLPTLQLPIPTTATPQQRPNRTHLCTMSTLSNESLTPSKPPTQPTNSLQPPPLFTKSPYKSTKKEDAVARLHSADRTTYKTYLRARTKLASKSAATWRKKARGSGSICSRSARMRWSR